VNLSNPGDQTRYPVDFTVKAGGFVRTVTVAPGKGDTVRVPAGSGPVTVTADGMKDVRYSWERPENCAPPTVTVANDCEAVAVIVTNPRDATPAAATVVYGDESKQLTVAPGASDRVLFPAGDATEATVTFEGLAPITVAFDKPDCDTGPGNGSGGVPGDDDGDAGEPGLPVTGPVAGGIAGVAALLLIGGGVFFFLARRRKVTFTA